MTTRRNFIKSTAAIGGALGLSPLARAAAEAQPTPANRAETAGRTRRRSAQHSHSRRHRLHRPEQVEYAIARGHRVTLFNRNKTRPGLLQGKGRRRAHRRFERRHEPRSRGRSSTSSSTTRRRFPLWVRNAGKYLAGQHQALHLHLDDVGLPRPERDRHQREQSDDADAGGPRPVHARPARHCA